MKMDEETLKKLKAAGREDLIKIYEINKSGWAGVLSNGNIVDRRKFPMAISVQKNSLLGIPEPKELVMVTYKFPFGMVSTFSYGEELIPELQGKYSEELHNKIKEHSCDDTQWNGYD